MPAAPPLPMLDEELVQRRVAFVTGHNGTTIGENAALGLVGPLSVLMANLAIPWLFPARSFASKRPWDTGAKLSLDFVLTFLPSILAYTVLADQLLPLNLLLALVSLAIGTFCICEYLYLDGEKPRLREALRQPVILKRPMWLAYARANVFLAVAIAILGVDLDIFPRRFAKTETFGYGLMDVGVGVFVAINGFTAPETKKRLKPLSARLRGLIPLMTLGLLRLAAVKGLGYQEHKGEYGLHWNFFFSLSVVKLWSSLIGSVVCLRRWSWLLCLLTMGGYEFALSQFNLRPLLLYGTPSMSTGGWVGGNGGLVEANKEGLASSVGILAVHFFGVQLGSFVLREKVRLKEWVRCFVQLCVLTGLLYTATAVAHQLFEPASRRIANATYALWIMAYTCWYVASYVGIELLVLLAGALRAPLYAHCAVSPFEQLEPNLWRLVSEGGLWFFLASNVLTGAANLLLPDLMGLSHWEGLAVLTAYAAVLVPFTWLIRRKEESPQ